MSDGKGSESMLTRLLRKSVETESRAVTPLDVDAGTYNQRVVYIRSRIAGNDRFTAARHAFDDRRVLAAEHARRTWFTDEWEIG